MIKPKDGSGATIIPKDYVAYNAETFEPCDKFIECTAEYALEHIEPATFDFLPGKKFLFFDTETYYTGIPANRMPKAVVRRYIKSGAPQSKWRSGNAFLNMPVLVDAARSASSTTMSSCSRPSSTSAAP